MKTYTEKELQEIRSIYTPGTRIRLEYMGDDDPCPVPSGTLGTIKHVDDIGTIHMDWDNGSSLGLIIGVDVFEIIS